MEGVQTSTLDYSNYHHSSVPEESQDSLFHEFYQPRQGKQELINYSYESMADNSSSQTLSAFAFYPRGATIAAAIAAVIFIITGVIGNLATIIALWKNPKLRSNATTWFVLSLAFSDFLFCTINLPLTASRYIHEAWIFNDVLCKVFPFFFYTNFGASLLNITLIAINRYILIAHYNLYIKLYQPKNVALMIGFVWTFCFLLLFPTLLEVWGRFGLDPSSFSCTILKKDGKSPKKFIFIFGILIPCITIILCYTCIFFRVRRSKRALRAHRNRDIEDNSERNKVSNSQKREDMRLTKMMLLIFCCFLLCFLPLMIFNVIDDESRRFSGVLHILASILAWASAVINPFIYAFSNRQYRQSYANLFFCKKETDGQNQNSRSGGSGKTTFLSEGVQINARRGRQ